MLKKAGVPAYAKTRDDSAAAACANVGEPHSLKSDSHGPNCGAAEGRSWRLTEMVRVMTAGVR